MIFITIDASSDTARSVAAAGTIRAACRRLVRDRQMSGGKGAKGGNLFSGPYSGAQVFLEGLRGSANRVAEIAENARTHRAMSGGKGAKGGNLESAGKTGPADGGTKRRNPAETGGNPFWGLSDGGKVFSGARIGPPRRAVGDWRIACGNCGNPFEESHRVLASTLGNLGNLQAGNRVALAEIAENAEIAKAAVGTAIPTTSSPLALTALTAPTCFRGSNPLTQPL
jgi:hypothetical protein